MATPKQQDMAISLWAQMWKQSQALLGEALESLERVDCQFWACEGPTLEPIPMLTCHRCEMVAKLRKELRIDPAQVTE